MATKACPELTDPLIERLSKEWQREDVALSGLSVPNVRIFWANAAGLIERRKRIFRKGWWIRLRKVG